MWNMNDVVQVRHVRDFILHVTLDNGMEGDIDLSDYPVKGPVFSALADPDYFKQVSIEGGTLAWPNGADISPERIYELVEEANKAIQPTR